MKTIIEITAGNIQQTEDALHLAMSEFKRMVSKMELDTDTDIYHYSHPLKTGQFLIEIDKEV